MSSLPAPDGGWSHLLRSLTVVSALWAIAAFCATALLLPGMDPQCSSTETARICPQYPDPALTHLFDAAWPQIPELWGAAVMVPAMLLAIGIALFVDTSEPWSETGGAPPVAGFLAGLIGGGVGLMVTGPGFEHPLVALGITATGAVLVLLGWLGVRRFRKTLRRRFAVHQRREALYECGTRTIATITALEWEQRYLDDDLVFTVTARLGEEPGARSVAGELRVPHAHVPVIGGTVVVLHDDQVGHATGIDFLLEADPDGRRDPDALEKYPKAPEGSPS